MNPRHRRMLIPGLLIALMVVVVIAALVDRAEAAAPGRDGRADMVLSDPRITESSGLAVSRRHHGLGYTVNDSGHAAEVFAIDLASGDVVGVTTVRATFRDVEALALRDGILWIGDVGDNTAQRDDAALYAIDEPGRSSRTVDASRYPVSLDGGPADVEALLAPPGSDRLFLVTKAFGSARVMQAPAADLAPDRVTTFRSVAEGLPQLVTDGAFSPDGSRVALLTYGSVWTVDPEDWSLVGHQNLPALVQSETLAFVSDHEVLVGSEGISSPLHRLVVALEPESTTGPDTVTLGEAAMPEVPPLGEAEPTDTRLATWGAVGAAALIAFGTVTMVVRRRTAR